jgi:RNAse (barnase) inhibitor barstar
LTLFEALFSSQEDELEAAGKKDYWRTIDANWDNILTANVTRIMQVSLAWQLLYDKEVDRGGRFKETLALGINWRI